MLYPVVAHIHLYLDIFLETLAFLNSLNKNVCWSALLYIFVICHSKFVLLFPTIFTTQMHTTTSIYIICKCIMVNIIKIWFTTFWCISSQLAYSAVLSFIIAWLSGTLSYSEVRAFLKKQPSVMTQCKLIATVNESIILTGNHLVFAREKFTDQFNPK